MSAVAIGKGITFCSAVDSAYRYTFLRCVVCLSLWRLSHSCTLLKPSDGFRCHYVRRVNAV